jgi:hypothetical protein
MLHLLAFPLRSRGASIAAATALALAALTPRDASADTIVAPYGGSTYRFQLALVNPPQGWQLPGFDDSTWANPTGAIGNQNNCGFTVTPIWPVNTQGLVRLHFTLPSGCTIGSLKLGFAIDNDLLEAYLNGTSILAQPYIHENCATKDSLVITPPAATFHVGDNVLAVRIRDRGGSTVYDHQVSVVTKAACAAPTPVCDEATKTCIGCKADADCGGKTPFCDVPSNTCVECLSDAACSNGGNVCVTAACGANHACATKPVADGTSCSDGNTCNGVEACKAGACQSGQPLVCNSGTPCLVDSCDPVKGCVATPAAEGTSCSDGNACNGVEKCSGGACQSGQPLVCNSGNPCLADSCDAVKGCVATPVADGTSCSDGNACNGAETCKAGACTAGQPLSCGGQGPCLAGSCDAKVGCIVTPLKDGTPCPDGDVCNGTETCAAGACTAGVALSCDDGDPCTADSCGAQTGCKHTPDADAGACQPDAGAGGQGGQGGSTGTGGHAGQGGSIGSGGQGGQGGSIGSGGQGGAIGTGGHAGQGGSIGAGGQGGQGGSIGSGGQGGAIGTGGHAGQGGAIGAGGQGGQGGSIGSGGQGGATGTTTTTTTTHHDAGDGADAGLAFPNDVTPKDGVTAEGGCHCTVAGGSRGDAAGLALAAIALGAMVARRRRSR